MTAPKAAIQASLIAKGVMTETGLTHKPRTRPCRHCRTQTVACIDDLGTDAHAWPTPTTPLGELLAKVAGLRTWHHMFTGGLMARGPQTITAKPAGTVAVLVEHRCGDSPPQKNPGAEKGTKAFAYSGSSAQYDPPPF